MTAPDTDWPWSGSPLTADIVSSLSPSLRDVSGGKPVITVSTRKEVEGGDGGWSYRVWFGDGNNARSHSDSLNGRGGGNSRDSDPIAERKLFMATLFHDHDAAEFMRG